MMTAKVSSVSLCISAFLLSLVLTSLAHAKIDPGSIVGIWLLDDGAGDTAKDASGNDNVGTLMNDPIWTDGKLGKALQFDGSDDHVGIGDADEMSGGPGKKITVVAWLNPGKVSGGQNPIVVKYLSAGEKDWGLLVGSGKLRFGYETGGNNFEMDSPLLGGTVNINTWYHGACVLDGRDVKIYLNGEEVGAVTLPTDTPNSAANVTIGGTPYRGDYFKGIVDEVAIFNTALSQEDIAAIMDGGLEKAIGGFAVSSTGKLAVTWSSIKEDSLHEN